MPLQDWRMAIHAYEPDSNGKCTSGWTNDNGEWVACGSRQRSSSLHDDPESDFRELHDHGGGDCMCFEGTPGGYYAAMRQYVNGKGD